MDFDVEVAIKVCRQAGYNKHAITLAKKHGLHEAYLQITLEDMKNYREALDYISNLDFANAELNMKKYGTVLMNHLPQETTDLLKTLCTDYKAKNEPLVSQEMLEGRAGNERLRANPDDFLHLFLKNNDGILEFLEFILKSRAEEASELVHNTLLENYLHKYKNMDASQRINWETKIMNVLSSPHVTFDNDHALVLCQLHNFRRGTLHLYERKGLHSQILKLHIELGDINSALATCRKFGPQNPNLWIQALQSMASEDTEASEEHMAEILNTIEDQGLMSPLLVIRALAGSPLTNFGVVRKYLLSVYQTEEQQINEHQRVIAQYGDDTSKVRVRIAELANESAVLQQTKCSACHHNLEQPTIHFMCGHSYHQHCFQSYSDSESECPACNEDNKKIMDIVKSQQQSREQHDAFHSQLEKSDDGFSVVAEYFGRGVFRKNTSSELSSLNKAIEKVGLHPTGMKPEKHLTDQVKSSTAAAVAATLPKPASAVSLSTRASSSPARQRPSSQSPRPPRALRQEDGRKNQRQQQQPKSSFVPVAPQRKPSPVAKNPFEEDAALKNPFDESPANEASTNPFDEDDYDESLNPFGDS